MEPLVGQEFHLLNERQIFYFHLFSFLKESINNSMEVEDIIHKLFPSPILYLFLGYNSLYLYHM